MAAIPIRVLRSATAKSLMLTQVAQGRPTRQGMGVWIWPMSADLVPPLSPGWSTHWSVQPLALIYPCSSLPNPLRVPFPYLAQAQELVRGSRCTSLRRPSCLCSRCKHPLWLIYNTPWPAQETFSSPKGTQNCTLNLAPNSHLILMVIWLMKTSEKPRRVQAILNSWSNRGITFSIACLYWTWQYNAYHTYCH